MQNDWKVPFTLCKAFLVKLQLFKQINLGAQITTVPISLKSNIFPVSDSPLAMTVEFTQRLGMLCSHLSNELRRCLRSVCKSCSGLHNAHQRMFVHNTYQRQKEK